MGAASPVAGIKPALLNTGSGPVRVACAMSVPRLGFQDHVFCWPRGLLPYGISPVRLEGAFWGQMLERVMDEIVQCNDAPGEPPLWILTMDYDTIFGQQDLPKLLTYATASDYDVVAAIQMKRRSDEPLFSMTGEEGQRMTEVSRDYFILNNIVPCNTAHFGFTLIRADSLKKVPHPWFLGVPDKDGKWGPERTDDDIYWWGKAREHGVKSGVCTRVVVGHAEVHFKWPDEHMKGLLQHPGDYWDLGGNPPEAAWK